MKKERLEERFGIKVLITILCLIVVQLGNIIPIPTINTAYFSYLVSKTSVLGMMNRFLQVLLFRCLLLYFEN